MINDIKIILAAVDDYLIIQKMAQLYVYDLSRSCGFISEDWALPEDGLYESGDFKSYLEDKSRKAYLIRVNEELAGFVLINKIVILESTDWNMAEFFIRARFQGQGVGEKVAHRIWEKHSGAWEVAVIPENKSAVVFWEKAINSYTDAIFNKEVKEVSFDKQQPKRVVFNFNAKKQGVTHAINQAHSSIDLNSMQLVGNSLVCRALCVEYAKDIHKHFTAQVTKYMWPSAPKTQEEVDKYILGQQYAMTQGKELALIVLKKDTGEFIGCCAIHHVQSLYPMLGIWLKKEAQGQGYGFEALSLLITWAKGNLKFDYLKYPVDKKNLASRALIEKLGGKIEAEYLKESESGKILDEVEYRIYNSVQIRSSTLLDIDAFVCLSHVKRRAYEKAQPQFWRYTGPQAEESQAKWFRELLAHKDCIMLTAETNGKVVGFVIGKLISAPEVYNPGGLTLMIDDFCVATDKLWKSVGAKLIAEIKVIAKSKEAVQILVVAGYHDNAKRHLLISHGLTVASEWFVGGIG